MKEEYKKICIIGGSGTGKTTLAENLGKQYEIPVIHLDGINYHKGWIERDKDERDQIILEKIKESKWIIDGTYSSTLKERISKADLIIYLDYSSIVQIKGVLTRYLKNPNKLKKEIPGCKERMNWKFFIWVLNWRSTKREKIISIIENVDKNKILIFKNRKQLNKWYKKRFNCKIDCSYC